MRQGPDLGDPLGYRHMDPELSPDSQPIALARARTAQPNIYSALLIYSLATRCGFGVWWGGYLIWTWLTW